MTAKEVLEKHSNKLEQGDIIKAMKEYARQKCKEQRNIINNFIDDEWHPTHTSEHISDIRYGDKNSIIRKLNDAPEPEFE